MKKLYLILILFIFLLQCNYVEGRARTSTEFRSYNREYTYNKADDGVIDRYYETYKDKCNHNTECVICIFPNSQALIGKSYTILTSGLIIIRTWDDFYLRGGVIKCHREYDNMYNFNSMTEARIFAEQLKERNKYIKRRN